MAQPFHEIQVYPELIPASVILHDPGKTFVDYHWHEAVELTASLDSQIQFGYGGEQFILKEDDVIVVNSAVVHRGIPVPGKESSAISLVIDPSFFKVHCSDFEQIHFSFDGKPEVRQEISKCMRQIYEICGADKKEPYYELTVNELLYHIVYLLLSRCQTVEQRPKSLSTIKYQQRYRRIMSYMNEHYNEPLKLEDIAEFAHISKEHLSREFKNYVGEGFREHLTNLRISKAQIDLLGTDMPLVDLALAHGFPDQRSYSKAFQKVFGMTPGQYRRKYKRISAAEKQ